MEASIRWLDPILSICVSKEAARTVEAVCAAVGKLLRTFTPLECANYFANAGYARI